MKILVLTEGGRRIGFGHLMRCLALVQGIERFVSKGNTKARFIINGDKTAKDFLKSQDVTSIAMLNWMREKNRVKNLVKASDMVIIDSYLAPKNLYDFIYQAVDLPTDQLVCIDDYNRIDYPASVVLNPSIYGNKVKYRINPESIYLLGPKYVILRREFWRIPERFTRKEVRDILFTFGGVDHGNFAERLIRCVSGGYSQFKYHFITPNSNLSARDMVGLMLKCDICISAGGQTIHELARIGLPTIGICFAENQRLNLEAWKEKGFVKYIGWYKDGNIFGRLAHMIEKILPYRERARCSGIGRGLISGIGKGYKDWFKILKQQGK